ncbi:MAG: hypothetical protein HKN12_05580, partial [Gemmatimonadetes bacterium]|nr:hypothetical protein [Gemmatimonadota bacterium]
MDDKLYYVESPDGQVLGPMNMILIIEGIAEGAILESARICEVGGQEWVQLSDVAYTREEEAAAAAPDEVDDVTPDLDMTPAFDQPEADAPAAETPEAETYEIDVPVAEAPAAETPAAEMPEEYEPVADMPAAEMPEEYEPVAEAADEPAMDEETVSAAEMDPTVYDLPMPIASEQPVHAEMDTSEFESPAAADEWSEIEEGEGELVGAG